MSKVYSLIGVLLLLTALLNLCECRPQLLDPVLGIIGGGDTGKGTTPTNLPLGLSLQCYIFPAANVPKLLPIGGLTS